MDTEKNGTQKDVIGNKNKKEGAWEKECMQVKALDVPIQRAEYFLPVK